VRAGVLASALERITGTASVYSDGRPAPVTTINKGAVDNMKRISTTGLAIVAAFALSAVMAAGASAHKFHAKLPTGGTFPAAVAGTGGVQKFKSGFGTITCQKASSTGQAKATEELTTVQTVKYKECTDNLGDKVTNEPIEAHYELSAEEKVTILKAIPIVLGGFANCTITVSAQGPLGGVKYKNLGALTELAVESATTGIVQTGSGGFCTNGTGEYTGTVTGKLTGGGELWWE
jgi:hypothetical protein